MKTLWQILADVGFKAGVYVDKNDRVHVLLALPPTKLAWIIEGAMAYEGAWHAVAAMLALPQTKLAWIIEGTMAYAWTTRGGCCCSHNNCCAGGCCCVPRPSRPGPDL